MAVGKLSRKRLRHATVRLSRMGEWRSCRSKGRYPTEHDAEKYRAKFQAARPTPLLRVYACNACSGCHITSAPYRQR